MHLSAPIYALKRAAKRLERDTGLAHHAALDKVAQREGFQSWSHLSASCDTKPAVQLAERLGAGDVVLIAGRPGHGKTRLALEVVAHIGRGAIFSLDYTDTELRQAFAQAGGTGAAPIRFDTSDAISADYIVGATEGAAPGTPIVIDYLQLLDQRRTTPDLGRQVSTLAAFAQRSGALLICLSQIDRRFDPEKGMPDLGDIRLPNPVDLTLFSRTVFVHDGRISVR